MTKTARTMALLLLASTALAACGKKEIKDLPPVADNTTGTSNPDMNSQPTEPTIVPGSQEDFIRSVGDMGDRIFFDTDRFNIDTADQATLQTQAQWLARANLSLVQHDVLPPPWRKQGKGLTVSLWLAAAPAAPALSTPKMDRAT